MTMRNSRRAGIAGLVMASGLGLTGLAAGVYFGVVEPALGSGMSMDLPVAAIVVMLALMTFLVTMAIVVLRKQTSAGARDDRRM